MNHEYNQYSVYKHIKIANLLIPREIQVSAGASSNNRYQKHSASDKTSQVNKS